MNPKSKPLGSLRFRRFHFLLRVRDKTAAPPEGCPDALSSFCGIPAPNRISHLRWIHSNLATSTNNSANCSRPNYPNERGLRMKASLAFEAIAVWIPALIVAHSRSRSRFLRVGGSDRALQFDVRLSSHCTPKKIPESHTI